MKIFKSLFVFIFGLVSGISASFATIGLLLTHGSVKVMIEDTGKTRRPISYRDYYIPKGERW